jgi:hypothetical protein
VHACTVARVHVGSPDDVTTSAETPMGSEQAAVKVPEATGDAAGVEHEESLEKANPCGYLGANLLMNS